MIGGGRGVASVSGRVDHASDWGCWTQMGGAPAPDLARWVIGYQGYREAGRAVTRRETPALVVPMILIFGEGFRLGDEGPGARWRPLERSFVAGLHERSVLIGSEGRALCLQVDLTPEGARRVLAIELGALRNRVVALEVFVGAEAGRLEDRLASTRGWAARFGIVERWLRARLGVGRPVSPEVGAAWARLVATSGAVRVEDLAAGVGLDRRVLAARFGCELGLPPKRAARVLRLERAMALLGGKAPLVEVALACGFFDQAQFTRELTAFCGESPRRLRARLLPDGGGLMVEGPR